MESVQLLGLSLEDNQHVKSILLAVNNLACCGQENGVTKIASILKTLSTRKNVVLKSAGFIPGIRPDLSRCPFLHGKQQTDASRVVSLFLSALAERTSI